jgi:hypothetical protein
MAVQTTCVVVALALAVVFLRSIDWALALRAASHVGPIPLASTLLATLASMLVTGLVWTRILHGLGHRASIRLGLTCFAGTGLASYVGSGAGATGHCVWLLRKHDVCAGRAAVLLAVATLIGFCGSMLWAPCAIILLGVRPGRRLLPMLGAHSSLIVTIATIVCSLGALGVLASICHASHLDVSGRGLVSRIAARISGSSSAPLRLSLRAMLALVPLAAISWFAAAVPLWVLAHAVAPGSHLTLLTAVGIQTIAAVVGGVAFFLPDGLGARDGTIVALLVGAAGMPVPGAVAAAVLVRLSDPAVKALIVVTLVGVRGRRPGPRPPKGRAVSALPGAGRTSAHVQPAA